MRLTVVKCPSAEADGWIADQNLLHQRLQQIVQPGPPGFRPRGCVCPHLCLPLNA